MNPTSSLSLMRRLIGRPPLVLDFRRPDPMALIESGIRSCVQERIAELRAEDEGVRRMARLLSCKPCLPRVEPLDLPDSLEIWGGSNVVVFRRIEAMEQRGSAS